MTSEKNRKEFVEHFENDDTHLCCLVLDFAKQQLVEAGLAIQGPDDAFGKLLF